MATREQLMELLGDGATCTREQFEARIDLFVGGGHLDSIDGTRKCVDALLPNCAHAPHDIEREYRIGRLSEITGVPTDSFRRELRGRM